jgi:hypothetical protein
MPDPMPRPTRFFFSDDFFGARIFDKFMLFSETAYGPPLG